MEKPLRKMENPAELGLPLAGADSHAHLSDRCLLDDLDGVLHRARDAGVALIGNVFLSLAAWEENRERFDAEQGVFFILGRHPTDAAGWQEGELDAADAVFAADPRFRAIGEIGLDYYWKDVPPGQQKRMFLAQAVHALERDLPVVIHCREAESDTLAILEDIGFRDRPLLWHCFGGDRALAERILGNGWDISVAGPVTYPANSALREAVRHIPPERLHVETDSPYLSPQNRRGKRNEPANVAFTAAYIADFLEQDRAAFWRRCGENTRRFFSLQA